MQDQNTAEFDAFRRLVGRALAVSPETIKARMEEHREQAQRNPNKRGPKPKVNASASDPGDQPDPA